jgi:predicted O-methyltransferase YrrM
MSWWQFIVLVVVEAVVLVVVLVGLRRLDGLAARLRRHRRAERRAGVERRKQTRRTVAAVARAADRHQGALAELAQENRALRADLARQSAALASAISRQVERASGASRAAQRDDVAQLEALIQVLRLADVREALPRTRGFPVSPDALLVLVDLVREHRPSLYLDLGSGTSTVVAASAARAAGLDMRVVAIDHDPHWAEESRRLVARHGLSSTVEVRLAPLKPVDGDPERRWYDPTALEDLTGIDLCFVDGPPGATNPEARMPAVDLVAPRLSERAVVVLDDTNRDDERVVAERWAARPEVTSARWPQAEKGLAVLLVGPPVRD